MQRITSQQGRKLISGVKGIIFDLAGTLIDTGCRAPVHAMTTAFAKNGLLVTDEIVRADMGLPKRAHIKAKVVKDEQEEVPFYTPQGTRLSDVGNKKLTTGDRVLKNQNTVIPSSPAEGHKDPASYTYNYLPKR